MASNPISILIKIGADNIPEWKKKSGLIKYFSYQFSWHLLGGRSGTSAGDDLINFENVRLWQYNNLLTVINFENGPIQFIKPIFDQRDNILVTWNYLANIQKVQNSRIRENW